MRITGIFEIKVLEDLMRLFNSEQIKRATGCLGAQLAISVHNCPVLADSRLPMSIFKRTQRKYVKKAYRVRNWREYEAGLHNRGSLTVWISLTAGKLVNWDAPLHRRYLLYLLE